MSVKINIKEIQKIETDMLNELNQICVRHNIKYFIHAGSALGAIRHKGPIPWDDDTDVLIELPKLNYLVDCLRKELSDRFIVDFYDINPNYSPMFPRIGLKNSSSDIVHVDIFPLVGLPDDRKEQVKFSKKSDMINFYYRFRNKDISKMEKSFIKRCAGVILKIAVRLIPKNAFIGIFKKHCNKYPYENAKYVMIPVVNAVSRIYLQKKCLPSNYGLTMLILYCQSPKIMIFILGSIIMITWSYHQLIFRRKV